MNVKSEQTRSSGLREGFRILVEILLAALCAAIPLLLWLLYDCVATREVTFTPLYRWILGIVLVSVTLGSCIVVLTRHAMATAGWFELPPNNVQVRPRVPGPYTGAIEALVFGTIVALAGPQVITAAFLYLATKQLAHWGNPNILEEEEISAESLTDAERSTLSSCHSVDSREARIRMYIARRIKNGRFVAMLSTVVHIYFAFVGGMFAGEFIDIRELVGYTGLGCTFWLYALFLSLNPQQRVAGAKQDD